MEAFEHIKSGLEDIVFSYPKRTLARLGGYQMSNHHLDKKRLVEEIQALRPKLAKPVLVEFKASRADNKTGRATFYYVMRVL